MAKTTAYSNRAMKSQDPRYAKIFGKLGYKTADMATAEAPPPARVRAPAPAPAPTPAETPVPEPEAATPTPKRAGKVAAITTDDAPIAGATPKAPAKAEAAPNARKAKALLDAKDSMSFFEFKAAAGKILGDATPAKKADIIAALEAVKGS